ncbi:MAG: hypothetical protein ACXW2T_07975, partial [Allosphingosinicella sp.]
MNFPAGAITGKKGYSSQSFDGDGPITVGRDAPLAGCQPLSQFLAVPSRLAEWRRLEKMAGLPMQDPSFVAAIASNLNAGADSRIYYIADN